MSLTTSTRFISTQLFVVLEPDFDIQPSAVGYSLSNVSCADKIDLKICSYLTACLTTSDSRDILLYCVLCAIVCLYLCDCLNPASGFQITANAMLMSTVQFLSFYSSLMTDE